MHQKLSHFQPKMNIAREQAICMFFSGEYNEENVARLSKKIDDFGSFDVCYETDPRKPVLLLLARIHSEPFISRCISLHPTKQCVANVMPWEVTSLNNSFIVHVFRILYE